MKVRNIQKMQPIHVEAEDTLVLYSTDEQGNKTLVTTAEIQRQMTVDTAVIFDVGKGELLPACEKGIGGAFLQTKRQKL